MTATSPEECTLHASGLVKLRNEVMEKNVNLQIFIWKKKIKFVSSVDGIFLSVKRLWFCALVIKQFARLAAATSAHVRRQTAQLLNRFLTYAV